VRLTTEALLAQMLAKEVDVHELFEWLRRLSFIEPGKVGLFPHDLAQVLTVCAGAIPIGTPNSTALESTLHAYKPHGRAASCNYSIIFSSIATFGDPFHMAREP